VLCLVDVFLSLRYISPHPTRDQQRTLRVVMKEQLEREVEAYLSGTYPFRIRKVGGNGSGRVKFKIVKVSAYDGDGLESIAHLIVKLSLCETCTDTGAAEFHRTRSCIVRLVHASCRRVPELLCCVCSSCESMERIQKATNQVLPLVYRFLDRMNASARQAAAPSLFNERPFAPAALASVQVSSP
jgi:hypothetical protein